jgi:hypothetical protein
VHSRDGLHRVRATNRLRARFGEAEVPHLPRGDQLLHRAGNVFNRDVGVDPVLVEQVDRLDAEATECSIRHLTDVLRPRVQPVPRTVGVDAEAELRRDHDLLTHRGERLADELLVGKRPVGLGGVEQGHAAFDGCANERDRPLPIGRRPIGRSQPHGAVAERGDFELARSEGARLHDRLHFSVRHSDVESMVWSLAEQPRERERTQRPATVLPHVYLRHHEGIGDLVAADDGVQANPGPTRQVYARAKGTARIDAFC